MDIFIGFLPDGIGQPAMERLVAQFDKKARVRLEERTLRNGQRVCFAIADMSDRGARKAMAALDGLKAQNEILSVREFHYRNYNNERRALNWRALPWSQPERRVGERRAPERVEVDDPFGGTVVEEASGHIRVEGYSRFARKW